MIQTQALGAADSPILRVPDVLGDSLLNNGFLHRRIALQASSIERPFDIIESASHMSTPLLI